MLLTVIVYTSLLSVLFMLSIVASRKVQLYPHGRCTFWTLEIVLSLLLFAFVFGVRYDVGIDFFAYRHYYEDVFAYREFEFLFTWITNMLKYVNMPVEIYFSLWSFLQLFFLLFAFREERHLYPFLILTLFLGQYFLLWTNVIRQDLATCIIIYAVKFIKDRKVLPYMFWVIIAMGFHNTAILCMLFYPLAYKKLDYTKYFKVWGQLILLFISAYIYISNINILGDIDKLLNIYLSDSIYDQYSRGAVERTIVDSKIGMTFLSGFLLDVVIISYSNKLKEFFHDKFVILYNLYFLGTVLCFLLGQSYILLRPIRYLRFFELTVLPYLLFFLYKNSRGKITNSLSFVFLIILLLVQYIALFLYSADSKYQYHSIFLGI